MDGIRFYILVGLAVLGLGLTGANTFWPKSATLSKESVERIDTVVEQWGKMGAKVEENTRAITAFNAIVQEQIRNRNDENDAGYDAALQRFGIDLGVPLGDVNLRMLNQLQGFGGGPVPGSQGQGTSDPNAAKAAPGGQAKTDGSTPFTSDNGARAPAGGDGQPDLLPR